jgi:hypothetical protein
MDRTEDGLYDLCSAYVLIHDGVAALDHGYDHGLVTSLPWCWLAVLSLLTWVRWSRELRVLYSVNELVLILSTLFSVLLDCEF